MEDKIKGDFCLFKLFQLCNIFLFFIGAGTFAAGVFICAKNKNFV